jgi:uncharacterized protein
MKKFEKYRVLRGHHLLCVHGFQGMGYSASFVEKMTEIVEKIRDEEKDFPIQIVEGFDEACSACPHQGETLCQNTIETDNHVRQLDRNVMQKLGIKHGEVWSKEELVRHTVNNVEPDDLDELCAGCSWLSYGVCKTGIEKLQSTKKKNME